MYETKDTTRMKRYGTEQGKDLMQENIWPNLPVPWKQFRGNLYFGKGFYSRGQRAKRTCLHVHLAALCAGGTRLAPTEVERRPAARGAVCQRHTVSADRSEAKTKYPAALLRCKFDAP